MSTDADSRHKYEYAVDPTADTAPARVIRMVGCDREVLEIGSGPGSITRVLYELNKCRITALEIDPEALVKVAPYCQRAMPADLNDPNWPALLDGKKFDVVIAADVLEHLYEPQVALDAMKSLISENGAIIVSLPHVGHAALVACLLDEDFEYRDWGLLDRTHIRFFGIKNIQALFEKAGLKIVAAEFVVRRPEATEFVDRWQRLSEEARRVALSNPFGQVYQVVVKAIPKNRPGEPITLMSLTTQAETLVDSPIQMHPTGMTGIRAFARRHLSDQSRQSIRRLAGRIGLKV